MRALFDFVLNCLAIFIAVALVRWAVTRPDDFSRVAAATAARVVHAIDRVAARFDGDYAAARDAIERGQTTPRSERQTAQEHGAGATRRGDAMHSPVVPAPSRVWGSRFAGALVGISALAAVWSIRRERLRANPDCPAIDEAPVEQAGDSPRQRFDITSLSESVTGGVS
jgi:hypothetical protein